MLTVSTEAGTTSIKTYWFNCSSYASGTTVYTVPIGKTARVWSVGTNYGYFNANGIYIYSAMSGSYNYGVASVPGGFLFPAGTVIAVGAQGGTIYIEEQ